MTLQASVTGDGDLGEGNKIFAKCQGTTISAVFDDDFQVWVVSGTQQQSTPNFPSIPANSYFQSHAGRSFAQAILFKEAVGHNDQFVTQVIVSRNNVGVTAIANKNTSAPDKLHESIDADFNGQVIYSVTDE